MTKKVKKILKFVVKYLLPVLVGWLEGDSHAVSDAITAFINVLI